MNQKSKSYSLLQFINHNLNLNIFFKVIIKRRYIRLDSSWSANLMFVFTDQQLYDCNFNNISLAPRES